MGFSSDGLLVYGIDFGDLHPITTKFTATGEVDYDCGDEDEDDDAYFDFDDFVVEKFGGPINIGLVMHCSYEAPMYILGIKSSFSFASRGYPERLGSQVVADPTWRETLKGFCDRFDIPFSEPEWLLASLYG